MQRRIDTIHAGFVGEGANRMKERPCTHNGILLGGCLGFCLLFLCFGLSAPLLLPRQINDLRCNDLHDALYSFF